MKLLDLIKERRSIRIFTGDKIPEKDISKIIEAGIWAPTGCNNQELRFLVLENENRISEVIKFKPFFKGVSHIILLFCDMSLPKSKELYSKNKFSSHLSNIDTGLALQNMVLQAKNIGIDSCIFNLSEMHYKRNKNLSFPQRIRKQLLKLLQMHSINQDSFEHLLRNILKIPSHLKIRCGVAFGYAIKYPDLKIAKHGWNKIQRMDLEHYLVKSSKK